MKKIEAFPNIEVDCTDMERCHHWPYEPWISASRVHLEGCNSCRGKYTPYLKAIDEDFTHGYKTLSKAIESFSRLAKQCGSDGEPGAAGALVINSVDQVITDLKVYMDKNQNDNIMALIWLQKVFVICRFFEAQRFCEGDLLETEEKQKVGKMETSKGEKFETITSLSHLMKEHDKNSTFEFNFELHTQIIDLIRKGEHYRALRLICDSPKHGVLSSILNFAAVVWAKQVYSIGLHALANVINIFIGKFRTEYNLAES